MPRQGESLKISFLASPEVEYCQAVPTPAERDRVVSAAPARGLSNFLWLPLLFLKPQKNPEKSLGPGKSCSKTGRGFSVCGGTVQSTVENRARGGHLARLAALY
jgi:hypothetical protein